MNRLIRGLAQHRIATAAIAGAHQRFMKRYPQWAASLLDEYFLHHQVLPLMM
jgi:hypothetical protein